LLSPARPLRHVDALTRNSSMAGLRKLHVKVSGPDGRLVNAILQRNASTLKDLDIKRYIGGMDIYSYFRLLAEFSRLESFALSEYATMIDRDFLDNLRSSGASATWRCRQSLKRLELHFRMYHGPGIQLSEDNHLLEGMTDTTSVMG
ncbi:hypothetical protein BGX33_009081, partial [Mortierella sp. NVP41]